MSRRSAAVPLVRAPLTLAAPRRMARVRQALRATAAAADTAKPSQLVSNQRPLRTPSPTR
ncbi:hypothetical protein [Streptomyces sp. bgisy027]|uniref:hypothetical protein n=1 Tax=unclassified Streptomyces TaxID=2593676 RepID=UPI003D70C2EC